MTKAIITVRFEQVGFHRWPNAPLHRKYLAENHRHLFKVEVSTYVDHDDREIEFHDLRDEAATIFSTFGEPGGAMGAMSCEMMARRLADELIVLHARSFSVSVWEDGEVGATVTVNL